MITNRPKDIKKQIRCIGTFDSKNKEVLNVLRKFWPLIHSDPDLKEVLTDFPTVTYRRGKILRDILVHSHFSQIPISRNWLQAATTGSHPCGRCSFCTYMPTKKNFVNPIDGKIYTIRDFINCQSQGVIYMAQCTCPKIYVGKTIQQLRRRISNHISTINTSKDTPLSRHIRHIHGGDIKTLNFWGICKMTMGPRRGDLNKRLLQEEARWIFRLGSLSPNGLNEGFTFASFL